MFDLSISEQDKEWLREKYPDLILTYEGDYLAISGTFHFDLVFWGDRIKDEYEVRVELRRSQGSNLPKVLETGNRIKEFALVSGIELSDLHINGDGSACLCLKHTEKTFFPNGFSIQQFFGNLVEIFFLCTKLF